MKKIKTIIALMVAFAALGVFADDSAPFSLNTDKGTRIAKKRELISYSTEWDKGSSVLVTADGATLKEAVAPASGDVVWDGAKASKGLHTFTHVSGGKTLTAQFTVLGDDVTLHSGVITVNEIWDTNKVHLVTGAVTVPSGVSLTISSGAVVKFMPGMSLTVVSGGSCTASGAIFTHVNDDTIGGDTLMDDDSTEPKIGEYAITDNIINDDTTEYRYFPTQTLTSNISSDTRLRGYCTYIVSNSVTVASGAKLTLQPGTVLKFNSGCSITVNGTLDAKGTRAAPIVFTSLKDDEHGGDTNGDGEKTYAQGGDWYQIRVAGTADFNYCHVFYNSSTENYGGVEAYSGTINFDNSEIAHTKYECVNAHSSGNFIARNSVFRDSSLGFGYYGSGRVKAYNCVFSDLSVAIRQSGKTLVNCVFYRCLAFTDQSGDGSSFSNCVFFNDSGYGAQSYTKCGSNGNIWGDPLFVDAENGDFRIKKGSPCINAGDSANAPEFDYYGQPRDDGAPDIGIYELAGGISQNDLAAVSVNSTGGSPVQGDGNAPAARSTIGDTLTISYSVANVGKQAVSGSWRDRISLVSPDGGYSINLGTAIQTATIEVGATNTFNASFVVPTEAEGRWRVAVGVNAERDIYEGVNVTNNAVSGTETIEISMPDRFAADGFSGMVAKGVPAVAKFVLEGNVPMVVRINAPAGTVVYLGSGFMPNASGYSARAVVGENGGLIGIPAGVTSAYLLVETTSSKGVTFTMTLESAALAVQSVSPATLPYAGTTGLVIDGANFAEGCEVVLECIAGVSGTGEPPVLLSSVVSATRMTAQIDCAKLTAGAAYSVTVVSMDGSRATLSDAVTVASVPAEPRLNATLDAPENVRRGRTLAVYIDYENTGNADMPVPIFELISTGQVFKVDGNIYTNSVKVMGLSAEMPVGTLRPGEPQRLGVTVTILSENVKWKLRSYHAAQEGAKKKLQLEALMGSDWVRDLSASDAKLYAAVCERSGATWSAFYSNLGLCLDANLDETTGILLFEEAVELFMGQVYDAAKEAAQKTSGKMTGQMAASLKRTDTPLRLFSALSGELTGTKHNDDNSRDGDVWWYRGAKWLSVTNESVKASLAGHLENVFLICHGNANSIHEEWIENMAAAAVRVGYSAALAVDWGDGSCSHLALNPEKNSRYIPAAASEAIRQLKIVGVTGDKLTVCGHSHGGHLGGIIAKGMDAKRLIGMDTSPIWTHKNTPASDRYPLAWDGNAADSVEFYKTSWDYSTGTDPADSKNGDIFGAPSFFVTQTGDFYKDAYKKGDDKHFKFGRALELHGYSHQWTRMNLGAISSWNWSSTAGSWNAFFGYGGAYSLGQGRFAGVFRGVEMECGADVKNRVAESMGTSADNVEWLYDRFVLGKDLASHTSGLPAAKSAATSLPVLQERWLRISEHGLDSFGISGTNADGVYELGGDGVELTMFIENYANNLSVDYNHSTVSKVEKPWQRGFGHLILIADVSDCSGAIANVVNDIRATGGASRLSWEKVMQLQNAGLKFAAINVEGGGMMNEDVFLRPVSGSIEHNYFLPLPGSVFPSGKTDKEEPRDAIVLGIVGVNANTWRKNGLIELYEGELCADNNCIARLIKVKPKGPSGEVLSGQAVEFYWSATQVSAFAPENVNIQDDNTWTADENGNWTVTLTGATSYGPTNIVAGSWTGFDCTVSQREWTPNPNVTVTGYLFTGEDGDFVPAQDYTVILAVEDANGMIGTKEYQFTIYRHTDEDDGEDEDEDDSNEPKSCDPNEMVGPEGLGSNRLVKPGEWMTYTVYFENKADAEAAAASVTVTNPLSDAFDWSTFEMLDVGFGSQVDTGLSGKHEGVSEQVMEGTNTSVRTELTVDETTGVAEWYLRIVDPNGDAEGWPHDVYAGFLPPNNPETHCGEGHLTYRIKLRDDAPSGLVITNSATIVFDYNEPITTDPAWWNTVAPETIAAKMSPEATKANEGDDLTFKVFGGNLTKRSSVQVQLAYNTASAADIDLKNGTVDSSTGGSPVPNAQAARSTILKFPLTITWAPGEIGEKTITIPVKTDKVVEADEFFTLQLALPKNMALGDDDICTVAIHDPGYDELKAKVDGGAATAKEITQWNKLHPGKVYVRPLATPATGGKVSGGAAVVPGKTARLRASALSGYVFAGWYTNAMCAAGQELVGYGDYRNPSLVYLADELDVDIFARFIPVEEDYLTLGDDFLPSEITTNAQVSIYVPVESASLPDIKVSGLPSGLKFYAKETVVKATKTTPAYTIAANTIYGIAPKRATTGPATVTVTVKNAGKYAITRKYQLSIIEGEAGGDSAEVVSDALKFYSLAVDLSDDFAGKVTGPGVYQAGKKVTVKATANKGYVFNGWYMGEELLTQAASYSFTMPETDVALYAKFVTAEEDVASIALSVDALGGEISPEAFISVTNTCGVALKWSVATEALSQPKVTVSGLPAGLKFTAKDIMKKGSKTEVEIPANTIYGAPTAESKLDAKTGLRKPSAVKFTVTTAGKSKRVYSVEMTVLPLPDWAVGTFNGGGDLGQVSLTVAKTGKLSGKYLSDGLTWSLAANSFDSIDESGEVYRATLIGKSGKLAMTNEVGVACDSMGGFAESIDYIAYRNNWKLEPWKTIGKPFAKAAALEYEDSASVAGVPVPGVLALKFAASGAVTVKGSFVTGVNERTGKDILYTASGSAVLAPQSEPDETGVFDAVVFIYLPPKVGKFDGYVRCINVRWMGDGWIVEKAL